MIKDFDIIKSGDKVICIDQGENRYIKNGKIYEVEKAMENMLLLKYPNRSIYFTNRFKKVEEGEKDMEFYEGMKVICNDDNNVNFIEKGKEYTVEKHSLNSLKLKERSGWYVKERFSPSVVLGEEELKEKFEKLSSKKLEADAIEQLARVKMLEIEKEKEKIEKELREVTKEYVALIKNKLEENK